MKRKIYSLGLPAIAAVLLALGGCTAAEPDADKLLAPDETIFSDGSNSASNFDITEEGDPLEKYNLRNWGDSSYSYYNFSDFYDKLTPQISIQRNFISNENLTLNFNYSIDSELESISWQKYNYSYINGGPNNLECSLTNITWNNNLITGCTYNEIYNIFDYSLNNVTGEKSCEVVFEYDEYEHLVKIIIDGAVEYPLVWENDDLISFTSPYFGEVRFEYYNVDNVYGQWDPSLPVMGPMQYFGWFGIAPKHFVKNYRQQKAADTEYGTEAINAKYEFNYYIGDYSYYYGLIKRVSVNADYNGSQYNYEFEVEYSEKQ